MNLQPLNPYQIIKELQTENEQMRIENEQLKKELAKIKQREGAMDDSVE